MNKLQIVPAYNGSVSFMFCYYTMKHGLCERKQGYYIYEGLASCFSGMWRDQCYIAMYQHGYTSELIIRQVNNHENVCSHYPRWTQAAEPVKA